ncbi:MAG: hypothetical protein IIA07_08775 [Proteobacteria bacterium]|nr:hypothetical protein [Pseudomonadota bacterium]
MPRRSALYALVIAAFALSGCSVLFPNPDDYKNRPDVVIVKPAPTAGSRPLIKPPPLPSVAIVLSSRQPAYQDVVTELTHRFEHYDVYDLSDRSRPPVTVLRTINDSDSSAVVAVGLRAAQSSVAMAGMPVVFSQVFNHQDHDLLTANSRGVAALAPLEAQLAAWKQADPMIVRVGAIIGDGHDELIAEAELAAQRHGMELHIQVAHSDQETLYIFRRMIRDIDGFWLFPDNRILSGRVLQQMLDEANRLRVPVAVPNESMLKMGATISMSTVASDIAETIVNIVREIQAGNLERVPPISQLSEIRVETNDAMMKSRAVAQSSTPRPGQRVAQ